MGWNDRYPEEERAFDNFLEHLLENECIEGAALGITKKVLSDGRESLTSAQEDVFQKYVLDENSKEYCSFCGDTITWDEMLIAKDNKWRCSHCINLLSKDD